MARHFLNFALTKSVCTLTLTVWILSRDWGFLPLLLLSLFCSFFHSFKKEILLCILGVLLISSHRWSVPCCEDEPLASCASYSSAFFPPVGNAAGPSDPSLRDEVSHLPPSTHQTRKGTTSNVCVCIYICWAQQIQPQVSELQTNKKDRKYKNASLTLFSKKKLVSIVVLYYIYTWCTPSSS